MDASKEEMIEYLKMLIESADVCIVLAKLKLQNAKKEIEDIQMQKGECQVFRQYGTAL